MRDRHLDNFSNVGKEVIAASIDTAVSLTAAVVFSFTPGFPFRFERIRSFCRTKAGTVTATVKVGARTVASITFTAATEVAQTLSTTLANLKGTSTEAITIELTTDGTGALTNGAVLIVIRPTGMKGD